MGILSFVCPSTGREVSTGIDIDAGSFTSLPTRLTQITCPYCNDHHTLSTIRSWLGTERSSVRTAEVTPPLPRTLAG